MHKSDYTKAKIFNVLIDQTLAARTGNVSVTDIARESGISRRTFYYHFESVTDTATWGFAYDLAQALERSCKNSSDITLVYPKDHPDEKYRRLPYYARKAPGIRTIDASFFFQALHSCIRKHGPYYAIMAHTPIGQLFLRHLTSLYLAPICFDIKFIAGGRPMKPNIIEMLASDFIRTHIISCFEIDNERCPAYPSDEKGLGNIAHDALKLEVNAYLKANNPWYIIKDLRKTD